MGIYLATAIVLILYMVLAWSAGSWLRLQGPSLWLVRGGLTQLGVIGAGVFLWFHHKLTRDTSESRPNASVLTEIDALIDQADKKLKSAKLTGGAGLRSLPLVFLYGEPNSAKTSTVLHSGLDAEPLAGVVYQETETAPTHTLNLWFARGTVFVEIGGAIIGSAGLWARILNRTSKRGLVSAFARGRVAPRAVLVCCDCERLRAGAEKLTSAAHRLSGQLQTMANTLGASFPIYVLFTKLDQVPKFAEFVSNLAPDEARQILGVTVPQRDPRHGMFAEEERNRLGKEFDQLVYSLAERRPDYLSRENSPAKLPAIYEFPREFRKIRDQVLTFLVEMSRPTQLGTNPFLRGFYFSGVRPVMVRENVAEIPVAFASEEAVGSGATRILSASALPGRHGASATPVSVARSTRIPEWTFLPYLFSEVILRDRAALGTSSQSSKTNAIRRLLLAALALLFIGFAIAFLVSLANNRALQQDVLSIHQALAASTSGAVDMPNVDQLKQLERLREILARLETNQRDGAPLSYRFGRYWGNDLYPEARRIYFVYFRRLILNSAEVSLVNNLGKLSAGQSYPYQESYSTLKAYLITTGDHARSSTQFSLAPVLLSRWLEGKGLDVQHVELARPQFEYYAEALIASDPYKLDRDKNSVEHAQGYLRQFNQTERVYQNMLNLAGENKPPVNFNLRFPTAGQAVIDSHEVPGVFTKDGFSAMQNLLQHPEMFSGGEGWVLGEKGGFDVTEALQQELRNKYYADFVNQWRAFLRTASVNNFTSPKDAASKLGLLSGNKSPLLQLLWLAQNNTNVDMPNAARAFQPVQILAKNSTEESLISRDNQPYMGAILNLQNSVDSLANNPNPQADTTSVQSAVSAAKMNVQTIAQGFLADKEGHVDSTVLKLLEDPITGAESLVRKIGPGQLDAVGAVFCHQYNSLANKYPFSANPTEATLQDVEAVFKPVTGALWTFYDTNLKTVLVRQGAQFGPSASATMRVSPQFISFLRHAAWISEVLYPAGSQQPHFTYSLRQMQSEGIDQLSLTIDGQPLTGAGNSLQFAWTGNPGSSVQLKGSYSGGNLPLGSYQGLWAPFHFLHKARWVTGSATVLEYPIEFAGDPVKLSNGTPVVVRYELESGAQMFKKDGLGMRCPVVGAR